uniref:Uncharacterized protein n=1 Tax=Arion vulgaris TaxID=1028688 RepID=A0A0B7A8W4_9EUPU
MHPKNIQKKKKHYLTSHRKNILFHMFKYESVLSHKLMYLHWAAIEDNETELCDSDHFYSNYPHLKG